MLFMLIGCNANKQIQLIQLNDNRIQLFFTKYSDQGVSFYLKKRIKLRNPYFLPAKMKMYYFLEGKQIDDAYAYPMDYDRYNKLAIIGTDKGEVWGEIKLHPLGEREIIYEIAFFSIDSISFTGMYKNLEQYISLAKHPLEENRETGEKYENKRVLIYEEPFSEFKRKNPELAESLIKGDTIELEVLSPIKAKYRYDAQW